MTQKYSNQAVVYRFIETRVEVVGTQAVDECLQNSF